MNEEQKRQAERLVAVITDKLKHDTNFASARYEWHGYDDVDVVGFIYVNGLMYRFVNMQIPLNIIGNTDYLSDEFVSQWNKSTSEEGIKSFFTFINDIERWGTN